MCFFAGLVALVTSIKKIVFPASARFVIITPEMCDAVIQHLRYNFFADEPLNKAVNLCKRGEPHEELELMCLATIANDHSIAALQNDQVICLMIRQRQMVYVEWMSRSLITLFVAFSNLNASFVRKSMTDN